MENDPHLNRFMSLLSLFTFFMLILVTASNFLQMFVGWEGVGLASYLLINFWFLRLQANKSAIKAMLVNRVGDFFLLLSLFFIHYNFKSLDYDIIFNLCPDFVDYKVYLLGFNLYYLDLITLLLFLGAMGKSAQLFFHTWLPDAMEGPTPVSALIHAATMVTAGVFLLTRCSYLLEYSPTTLNLIMFIGALTSFFAASTGLFQNDMKKVIAYSTCSQLGYMIFACGLSSYDVAMFHLSNHAFFKALLFLGAGSIIHSISDEQDMRKTGGLKNLLPFSYSIMLIGSLALIGFPFLSGFYSKDTILEIAYSKFTFFGHLSYYLGCFSAFCTAFYSTRLLFLVFLSEPIGNKSRILNAHESSFRISLPLILLSVLSIFVGFLTKDLFVGFNSSFWNTSIFILPTNYLLTDIEFMPLVSKQLPLILTVLGCCVSYFVNLFKLDSTFILKMTYFFRMFYNFLSRKWYFDRVYNEFVTQNILFYGFNFSYKIIDRGLLEFFGPTTIINTFQSINLYLRNKFQTGYIFDYLFDFLLCFLFFIFLLFLCTSML